MRKFQIFNSTLNRGLKMNYFYINFIRSAIKYVIFSYGAL